MPTTHCLIPLLGKRIRATTLDNCGRVPAGATYVATDGFVTVKLSSEVEEGSEIIVRKASGALCVNEKLADSFKRFTVEIEFCGVNPSLLSIVSNAKPVTDASLDVIGFSIPEGMIAKWFSLELWTGLSGAACPTGTDEMSGYMLLPFVTAGVLGDIEIGGEDAITFSITGAYTKGGNSWGKGPYQVVKTTGGALATLSNPVDPYDHLVMIDTAVAPPPAACSPTLVASGVQITSVSPSSGPVAGGTVTTITGYGFTGATGVTFGGTAGTVFSVNSNTMITVTTPAKTAGAVAVQVLHPSGNATLAAGYTYV